MGLEINEQVETKIFINSSGKTVTYTLYDEADAVFATGSMAEIASTGIYTIAWTPDAAGEWTIKITCLVPTVNTAFIYMVGKGQEKVISDAVDVIDSYHDVPSADVVTNAQVRDVVGNKTDAATQDADATEKTIISLVKGILDVLYDTEGVAAYPAAVKAANGVSLAEVLRYISDEQIGEEFTGAPDIYDVMVTGYTTAVSATRVGSILERLEYIQDIIVSGDQIFTASSSSTSTLTSAALLDIASNYIGQVAVPMAGNMDGQGRYITAYNGTNEITVSPVWAEDPGSVDFIITPSNLGIVYDALAVPGANVATNLLERDVIGNKTDTTVGAVTTDKSLVGYTKGILEDTGTTIPGTLLEVKQKATGPAYDQDTDSLEAISMAVDVIDGYHDVPAKDATTDSKIRDVVGKKDDTTVGAVGTNKSLIGYAKGILEDTGTTIPASIVVIDEYHDVPAADATLNAQINEVIGNKSDAAQTTVGTTRSLVSYLKGVLNQIVTLLGRHEVTTADATTDAYIRDVVGRKTDTQNTTIGTTSSLMRYVKGILTMLQNGTYGLSALETLVDGLETSIGSEFDGTPDLYDVMVSGYNTTSTPLTNGSIFERFEILKRLYLSDNLVYVSDSSTVNSVTDATLDAVDDQYNGMLLIPITLSELGRARYVYDYDGATKTLYVDPPWETDPESEGAFSFILTGIGGGGTYYLDQSGHGLLATFNTIDAIPNLERVGGSLTATGAEDTVMTIDAPGGNMVVTKLTVDLTNMVAGDTVVVKYKERTKTAGNMIISVAETFNGPQTVPLFVVGKDMLGENRFGWIVTLEQTAGTNRIYDWQVFYEG